MPTPRAPITSMSARSPTKRASAGRSAFIRSSAVSKMTGLGLRQPTSSEITMVSKRWAMPSRSRIVRQVGE